MASFISGQMGSKASRYVLYYFSLSFIHLERHFPFLHINLAVACIREPSKARPCSSAVGEGLPTSRLKNDNNKRDMPSQGDGAQSKAKRGRGFEMETLSEPAAPVVPDFG